jgi:hypothetical protein
LQKDYLSLAEVQVMGVDPLRFAEVDVSSALNNFGGWYNAPNAVIEPSALRAAKAYPVE